MNSLLLSNTTLMKKSTVIFSILFFILFAFTKLTAQTVYITETGKKYHVKSCPDVKTNGKAIQLTDAKKKGYGACTSCGADKIVEESKSSKKKKEEK